MPTGPPSYEFTTSPYFLVRVAGLSAQDVEPLSSPRSIALLDHVLDLEQSLESTKADLVEALGAAVAATGEAGWRRRLLALRRDVHNLRRPDPDTVERVVETLDSAVRDRLRSWLAAHKEYESELADGAEAVGEELRRARLHLRRLGRDHRLRQGIQLGAPLLADALPRYLDSAAEKPLPKRLRGVERSLLNYAFRSAFKTSPFSSFTRVCLGRFDAGGDVLALDVDAAGFQNSVTFNLAALGSIAQAVLLADDVRRALPVRLTPGWRIDGARIRYVRRQYGYNSDPTAPTQGLLEEVDFSVPRGEVLDEIIEIVRQEPGIALEELAERLHAKDPAGRPRDRLAVYADRLLELGLLVSPELRLDPCSPDPARDFADRVGKLSSARAAEASSRIERLAACAEEYASATLARRAELAADANRHAAQAQRELGRASPVELRTAFYEDRVASEVASAGRDWWKAELLPQLERLTAVLPAFDPLLLDRMLARGYFRDRHGRGGRCDDIAGFAHEFQRRCSSWMASYEKRDVADADGSGPFSPHELAALRDARGAFAAELRERCLDLPEDAPEVCIDDELLDRVREPLAAVTPGVLPASFFVQLARQGDDWLAVLNFAYTGLGMPIGRFSYPLERATGHRVADRLRAQAGALQPGAAVFAELTGGYDASNLSWHAPLTPYQIVGPAEISFRPPDEQLPIDDLVLVDDPVADELRLHSKRLGLRVIPVYLGSLMPVALPEVQRTLLALSCTMMPNLNFRQWLINRRIGELTEHPRVRYRNVVLQRRGWSVPTEGLPPWDGELTGWLLEWRRWWRDHRLPTRLFYSVPARASGTRARIAEKPQYVSADSVLSMMSFAHDVRTAAEPVRMTEMLPDQDESWPTGAPNSCASELCIEVTGVRKGKA
jgi:hypothetical protein